LEGCQKWLPPNWERLARLLILRVHANKVVSVHDGVDKSVEQDGKVNISVIHDIGIEPVEKEDGEVMVHVKEGELTPLLSQNNEDCIPKVPYLGDVEEPKEVTDWRILYQKVVTGHGGVSMAVG